MQLSRSFSGKELTSNIICEDMHVLATLASMLLDADVASYGAYDCVSLMVKGLLC